MSDERCPGCSEYHELTRRNFVGLASGLAVAAVAPAWLPRVVFADSDSSSRDVIVSIFLRGGADGLTLCVPYGEPAYFDLRPNLAIAPPDAATGRRVTDLDGFFGLPPALGELLEAYRAGDLLIVHGTGLPDSSRSHFDAMRFLEVGQAQPPGSLQTGWLGRHLAATAPSRADAVLRAIGIGFGLQRTLVGAPLALPIADPADFGLDGRGSSRRARSKALDRMYRAFDDPLKTSADATFRTVDLLKRIGFEGYRPSGGAEYPEDEFGSSLRAAAALIKAEAGVEAVAIDLGGWDTHDFQGPVSGFMAQLMGSLAGGLAAFHQDLDAGNAPGYVAAVMSEFGRNAFENGSAGTDHGSGGTMLVLGGAVDGGRVLADWPGLAPGQLFDGQDLAATIDSRDVLWEILDERAESPSVQRVFPDSGYRPTTWGVIG